jgi:putative membrane protein
MKLAMSLAKPMVPSALILITFQRGYPFAQSTTGKTQDCWYGHGPGMMWGGDYGGGFGMVFGFLLMLIFLAGTIAAIVWAIRYFTMGGTQSETNVPESNRENALGILKERFAKGEIDAQEFAERKRVLSE